jgi:hypothetical protein
MTTDPTGRSSKPQTSCDLCGADVGMAVGDDLWSFAICAGCSELWTTYLMHHQRSRRQAPEPPRPRTEFGGD